MRVLPQPLICNRLYSNIKFTQLHIATPPHPTVVWLHSLSNALLNGQRATVQAPSATPTPGRCPVQLMDTPGALPISVKLTNLSLTPLPSHGVRASSSLGRGDTESPASAPPDNTAMAGLADPWGPPERLTSAYGISHKNAISTPDQTTVEQGPLFVIMQAPGQAGKGVFANRFIPAGETQRAGESGGVQAQNMTSHSDCMCSNMSGLLAQHFVCSTCASVHTNCNLRHLFHQNTATRYAQYKTQGNRSLVCTAHSSC